MKIEDMLIGLGEELPAIGLSSPTTAVLKKQKKASKFNYSEHILGHFRAPCMELKCCMFFVVFFFHIHTLYFIFTRDK